MADAPGCGNAADLHELFDILDPCLGWRWREMEIQYPFSVQFGVIGKYWMVLPSGELTFCHGKSQFLMGKSTISTGPFSIAMLVHQRVHHS